MRYSAAASSSCEICGRDNILKITSTPPAPAARASNTWYGSTRKSLRIAGTPSGKSTALALSKCSSAPSKRVGSVSTDTAAAPPRAYAATLASQSSLREPILALRDRVAPPTINLEDPDDDIVFDIATKPRPLAPRTADAPMAVLNDAFGFGGHNVALAFTEYVPSSSTAAEA